MADDALGTYRRKRRFAKTPEPPGEVESAASRDGGGGRFVVQEHHARRLHWDLRLERDGVLVSWAVPNGLPVTPKENRKAVHTEDHPMQYLDFHGDIPTGEYGAGSMAVWDHGTYTAHKWRDDEVIVTLEGTQPQARGRYALFRAGKDPKDWMIHRMDPPADPAWTPMPEDLQPMYATLGALPPAAQDDSWSYEVKWDGVRALTWSRPGRLRMASRNGNDITARYPELRPLNRALSHHEAVLDGEVVAFDDAGRPSFERLQSRMHVTGESTVRRLMGSTPVHYMLFDLLYLDGHLLVDVPYDERRRRLEDLGLDGEHWRVPAAHAGHGAEVFDAVSAQGLEGLVAKRRDSRYEPGRRTRTWVKVKARNRQEVVVGGWLPGAGRRAGGLGALLVGVHDGPGGPLRYAGRVGTGFDDAELVRLERLLAEGEVPTSPFSSGAVPKGARFVRPDLVAEVEFAEWTREGVLRQPAYKGLRDDKPAGAVVHERAVPADDDAAEADAGVGDAGPAAGPAAAAEPEGDDDRGRLLAALVAAGEGDVELAVEGRTVRLANPRKVLFPATGTTKAEVVAYLVSVADAVLPHLRGRPVSLKRYPDGVEGPHFWEKACPSHRPDWVRTEEVRSRSGRTTIRYCVVDDLPTLVWLANLAAVELHVPMARVDAMDRPTAVVFDLDPGAPATVVACAQVALRIRDLLELLGLTCVAKTSGSKGLQVTVPLNDPEIGYERTKPFAQAVARLLQKEHPELVTATMTKRLRESKVLVDWSQNDQAKTTVAAYSLRAAHPWPSVSTPVTWDEVDRCASTGDDGVLRFDADAVVKRVTTLGDLFAPVVASSQVLPVLG